MVFDEVLAAIPSYEGFAVDGVRRNHIAYADDLVLIADSKTGLQNITSSIMPALSGAGLEINIAKSMTLQWIKDGKNKRILVDQRNFLLVDQRFLFLLSARRMSSSTWE